MLKASALFVPGVYFKQVLYRCLWLDFDAVFGVFFSEGIALSVGLP